MNHTKTLLALGGVCLLAACSETPGPTTPTSSASQTSAQAGGITHIMLTRAGYDSAARVNGLFAFDRGGDARTGGGSRPRSGTGISYHGGPVIHTPHIFAIYWASSTIYNGGPAAGTSSGTGGSDNSLLATFMSNLGGSNYWNINTTYNDAGGAVQRSLGYTGYVADNTNVPASGSSVSDAAVQGEVTKLLNSHAITWDGTTLYAVFSGPGVNLGGGFGTQYCAYHGHFTWNGNDVKYAVMPHDYDFPSACSALNGSPNNDFATDAEVNTLAHETEETMTDEDLNAWYDSRGNENADKCAWQFGSTYSSNGAVANMNFGGHDWLVQMNWVNANSGGCLQHWP